MAASYCPRQGDVVWLSFDPHEKMGTGTSQNAVGTKRASTGSEPVPIFSEQAGLRPALVLSPERYNRKVGLALFCPITSHRKGYPFEVAVPPGLEVSGVILSDQVKSLDWKTRKTRFGCKMPVDVFREVVCKLGTLTEM